MTSVYMQSIYIFQAWYRELLLKDEWGNDMKIFDLDWNQYDQFCHEYQKDKVTTMPVPAVPIGYKQPMDLVAKWDRGVRQDPSNFPTLKEMKQWDKWKLIWTATATAQLVEMVHNSNYKP
jgi:hypothetical protein